MTARTPRGPATPVTSGPFARWFLAEAAHSAPRDLRRRWIDHVRSVVLDGESPGVDRDVSGRASETPGQTPPASSEERRPPGQEWTAEALLEAYLWSLGVVDAKEPHLGAVHTPREVADALIRLAFGDLLAPERSAAEVASLLVVDPACGAGRFLERAAAHLVAALTLRGWSASDAWSHVVSRQLLGIDIDADALDAARLILCLSAKEGGADVVATLLLSDALLQRWVDVRVMAGGGPRPATTRPGQQELSFKSGASFLAVAGPTVVVGNPPFLNQLERSTSRSRERAKALADALGSGASGYVDDAVLFMLRAVSWLAPGGRAALLWPLSALGAAGAEEARTAIRREAVLRDLWVPVQRLFPTAQVLVAGVVVEKAQGVPHPAPRLWTDLPPIAVPAAASDGATGERPWVHWAATAAGLPDVRIPDGPQLGSVATATADFRDQYYGLQGHVIDAVEAPPAGLWPPLVTTGLLRLADNRWGQVPTRFGGQRWMAPRVDLVGLRAQTSLGPWAEARLVPKVLVATQCAVLEGWVDDEGAVLPSVPLLTVTPMPSLPMWSLAAAIFGPVATLVAARLSFGLALQPWAITLSAARLRHLPLPTDAERWQRGAMVLRDAQGAGPTLRSTLLDTFGREMAGAYGLDDRAAAEVFQWWHARRRRKRDSRSAP